LNEGQAREVPAVLPPIEEQRAIADFLDEKTAAIDDLIADKLRMVELLAEERRRTIGSLVWEGLNPAAPMVGREDTWLGRVPAHWSVMPIKRLARAGYRTFTDGDWIESPYITDEGIRLLQTGNVGIGRFKEQGFRYVSEETFRKLRCTEVEPGDVLICRLADPVGRACLAPDLGVRMITSVDVCILKPDAYHHPKFITYLLSSDRYLNWIASLCRGSTRDRVSRSMLGDITVAMPPHSEQIQIVSSLDERTARIDSLADETDRAIELLREYRQSLISEAVTGKLPVREEAFA
jgi:type I restriction enzyme S subunit